MIEQVDFYIRIIAVGAGLMLIALIVSNQVRAHIQFPLVGVVVGAIGYLINSTPLLTSQGPLDPWIDLVSISAPFWIWLFARRLFEREPERRVLLGTVAILLIGWFMGNFIPALDLAGFVLLHIVLLALIADLIRVGVLERDDDLIEQRRVIRLWLPLLVAAQAGAILSFELFSLAVGFDRVWPPAQLFNAVMILTLTLFSGIALMRTDDELLAEPETVSAADAETPALNLSPSEAVLHDNLKASMAEGAYREPGLSIAGLADRLDTPEHRLRALINQRLGYRNFSAFLNRHRIAEAREKLASRDEVDMPVLTIAMDLGYNSLPTFNRAFRSETGTTPSEFRRLAIAESTPEEAVQN